MPSPLSRPLRVRLFVALLAGLASVMATAAPTVAATPAKAPTVYLAQNATTTDLAPSAVAAPQGRDAPSSGNRAASVLVRLHAGVPQHTAAQIARDHGVHVIGAVEGTGFLLFSVEDSPVEAVARDLAADGRLETAEPNHVRSVAAVADDPYFAGSQAPYMDLVRLPEAWALTTGSDELTLAIVDSGVKASHPDLAGRLLTGRDFVNNDENPDDDLGHGTQVATVAAATGNNGRGMAGVAWRGKVLPVKVIDGEGKTRDSDIAAGITWAVDQGADVINLSFGGTQIATKIVKDAIQHARDRDVVVVAAAGNSGRTLPIYPAALDGVVAVAATDRTGRLAAFSDSGPWVDLAAPGEDVIVGWRDGGYRVNSGTSFAAPVVSGVAMLARARFPHETADQIVRRIQLGASDTGPIGPDDIYGYGVVDAVGTLTGATWRHAVDPALLAREPDSTPDRATVVPVGGTTTGQFAPERDIDWYAVDITDPRRHTFTIDQPVGEAGLDPILSVFDPQLRLLWQRTGDRHGHAEITLHAAPGRYYLRVQNRTAAIAGSGRYSVVVDSLPGPLHTGYKTTRRGYYDNLGGSAVVVGDLTGSGAGDVLGSHAHRSDDAPDHNSLLLMPRAGTDVSGVRIPTYGAGSAADLGLAVVDVDDDGDDDAVLATSGGLEIYHQINGTLRDITLVPAPGPVTQVEAGDVNGDGLPDLVAARAGGGITVLLNEGRAVFSPPVEMGSLRSAEIEVADLDGDGRHEIVALECDPTCRTVAVYRSGAGGFARTTTRISPDQPCGQRGALGVGNVMGDSRLDVFASCGGIDGVHLLTLDGTGGLERRPLLELSLTDAPVALESGDIDRDGRDEILALHDDRDYLYAVWVTPDGSVGDIFDLGEITVDRHGPKGLAVGDLNGDGGPDVALAGWEKGVEWMIVTPAVPTPLPDGQQWIRDTVPATGATDAATDATLTIRLAAALHADTVTRVTVRLTDAFTDAVVAATVTYDTVTNSVVVRPDTPLTPGHTYEVTTTGLQTADGVPLSDSLSYRFAVGPAQPPIQTQPAGTTPQPSATTAPERTGYWMLDAAGSVYDFGDAAGLGHATSGAIDLEPTPTGRGYWTLNRNGVVSDFGDAAGLGNVNLATLAKDEAPASLSATPTGKGYWVFTNRGRAITFGDAPNLGDMSAVKLNGPVLGSVATPSGRGYYMVASDGGIFAFGDAAFAGSMGGKKLNAPVQSLVPDADGAGYWLVASDGGIFAFAAPFRGSMGHTKLNKPIVGMVRYGDGYLMVGADGGIFNFSSLPFAGSLGDQPPAAPVVAVAALP